MEKIGLDTALFIYLFEAHPRFADAAGRLLQQVSRGELSAVFSAVGLIELLTGPKKRDRPDIAAEYREHLLAFPNLVIWGVTEPVVEVASDLRACYGIATPDAIHIATALDFGAERFVTNDRRLLKVREIKVEMLLHIQ